jgi:hypothetical protein
MLESIAVGHAVVTKDDRTLIVTGVTAHDIPWYPIKLSFDDGTTRSYMWSGQHHYMRCKHDIVKVIVPTVVRRRRRTNRFPQ